MRKRLLFAALAATSFLGACKWTDFDDLEDQTWVRSTEDPEIGVDEYAVAIAGVSTGTTGGTLAVLSDDEPNFSLLEYDADGGAAVGANPVDLGTQRIGAIADAPLLVTDPTGRIAIIERSINGGNLAVVFGSATATTGVEFPATAGASPDAAVFVPGAMGQDLVIAAASTLHIVTPAGDTTRSCTGIDGNDMPLQVAAMDHDGTNLVIWTKSGSLVGFPLASLCSGNAPLPDPPSFSFTPPGVIMPGPGARVHVSGRYAILTGHPTTSRSGSVYVVKLPTMADPVSTTDPIVPAQVGTTLAVEGLRSSTLAVLGGETYLAVGIPERSVEGVVAGEVDLHVLNTTSGALDATASLSLHDAQPDSGQQFGRSVTTMNFNGSPILVVAGKGEIYAYYRTALYDQLP